MPPAAARNAFVILFDLKTQSRPNALSALTKILLYKQLSQTKDVYKLYLVNSAKSDNVEQEGIHFFDANVPIDTLLEELGGVETGKSDWLEALNVGITALTEFYDKPGIITLQLLFITDLSTFERPNNGQLLETVTLDITSYDMFLYVIGPNIEPPKIILSGEEIKEWMQSMTVDKSNSNLKIMKKIVTKTPHSVMCTYDIGVHLFNSFEFRKGGQPWQAPLTFGTALTLNVSTIRLTKKEPPFNLKNTALKSSGDVKWVYEDQEDVEISFHDTVGGLVRHGKFVKIETDGMFKIEGPRSFSALGFTSAGNVPEYLLQSDGSYFVIPDQNQSQEYLEFFAAFVEELKKEDKYILARRVYNKDCNPKFVVLNPCVDYNIKGFILCELPYADDIAHVYKAQDVTKAPEVEKNQKIFNFLDSINASREDSQVKVPLAPAMMVDPNCLNIIKKVEEKKIQENLFEMKIDPSVFGEQQFTENIKSEWPVRELLKAKKEENDVDDFDEIGDFDFS